MNTNVKEIRADNRAPITFWQRAKQLAVRRELLVSLIRKDLKVRYKNSSLGFVWSMINPLLYLAVFFVVFNYFLPGGVPRYHVYLLAGLLPWTLFSTAIYQGTGSVVAGGDLVKKVFFPREMLPLSTIGAALFHFALQFIVLLAFLLITRHPIPTEGVLLLPAALAAEILLLTGFCFLFSAINVKARDMQYLIELILLPWFWMTPIVYPSADTARRLQEKTLLGINLFDLYLANPMSRIVLAFQRGIYGSPTEIIDGKSVRVIYDAPLSWFFGGIGITALIGIALIVIGWWTFRRLESIFAEEL